MYTVNQDGNGNPPVSLGNKSSFVVYVPLPVLVYQSVSFLPNRKPPLISIVLFFSSLVTMEFWFSRKMANGEHEKDLKPPSRRIVQPASLPRFPFFFFSAISRILPFLAKDWFCHTPSS